MASDPRIRWPPGRRRRRHGEDGNTLLLVPVGVLVLLVLGAIAVDFAIVFMAEREVANLSAGIANDAAGALDDAAFFEQGEVVIDPARAEAIVADVIALRPQDTVEADCAPTAVAADEIEVTCQGRVPLIFAPALPGGLGTFDVEATSRARAARD